MADYVAWVKLAEAARLADRDPSTITRAANKGKISFEIDSEGDRVFSIPSLESAYGKLKPVGNNSDAGTSAIASESTSMHEEIKQAREREIALMQMQIDLLRTQNEDLQKDRDHWRHQATNLIEDKREKNDEKAQTVQKLVESEAQLEKVRGSWLGRLLLRG